MTSPDSAATDDGRHVGHRWEDAVAITDALVKRTGQGTEVMDFLLASLI
jgi:hypothetical protein